eukprot:COSAG04_NODE_105_length_25952_cov_11.965278_9_plen_204_part_00
MVRARRPGSVQAWRRLRTLVDADEGEELAAPRVHIDRLTSRRITRRHPAHPPAHTHTQLVHFHHFGSNFILVDARMKEAAAWRRRAERTRPSSPPLRPLPAVRCPSRPEDAAAAAPRSCCPSPDTRTASGDPPPALFAATASVRVSAAQADRCCTHLDWCPCLRCRSSRRGGSRHGRRGAPRRLVRRGRRPSRGGRTHGQSWR